MKTAKDGGSVSQRGWRMQADVGAFLLDRLQERREGIVIPRPRCGSAKLSMGMMLERSYERVIDLGVLKNRGL